MENEDKSYYKSISKVAEMFHESQSTLRFWEKEFGFPKPHTNKKGTRSYTEKDIEDIKTIHYLLRGQKLTIKGAKEKLKSLKKDDAERNGKIVYSLTKVKEELLKIRAKLGK